MKRVIYITVVLGFIFLILLVISSSRELYDINEEASPIREGDSIVGMDYVVTIGENVKRKDINISTSIIPSILHYKDINNINDFYVDLKIKNNSKGKYLLKNIMMVSNGGLVNKNIKYTKNSNYISIKLSKNDLLDYSNSFIKLELKK